MVDALKRYWLPLLIIAGFLAYTPIQQNYTLATGDASAAGTVAGDLALTRQAKLLFYGAAPEAKNKADFQKACPESAQTPELGCFVGNKIYYLTIDRPEFKGQEEVTAAHEMLHAAYERLNEYDKRNVDRLVEAQYKTMTDPELRDRMAQYAKSEPGQQDNELHSILATEYKTLSPDLENYYSKYFETRQAVVAKHQAFTDAVNEKSAVLANERAALAAQKASLTAFHQRMENLLASHQIAEYNSQVDNFNNAVKAYNEAVNNYNLDVAETNKTFASIDSTQLPSATGLSQQ